MSHAQAAVSGPTVGLQIAVARKTRYRAAMDADPLTADGAPSGGPTRVPGRIGTLGDPSRVAAALSSGVRAGRLSALRRGMRGPGKQGRDDEGTLVDVVRNLELHVHRADVGRGEYVGAVLAVA